MAADSTMLRIVNLLMALSLGVQREQFEHLIGLTWPRPFLLRPLDARFLTMIAVVRWESGFEVRSSTSSMGDFTRWI